MNSEGARMRGEMIDMISGRIRTGTITEHDNPLRTWFMIQSAAVFGEQQLAIRSAVFQTYHPSPFRLGHWIKSTLRPFNWAPSFIPEPMYPRTWRSPEITPPRSFTPSELAELSKAVRALR